VKTLESKSSRLDEASAGPSWVVSSSAASRDGGEPWGSLFESALIDRLEERGVPEGSDFDFDGELADGTETEGLAPAVGISDCPSEWLEMSIGEVTEYAKE